MLENYMKESVCQQKNFFSVVYMPFVNLVNFMNYQVFFLSYIIFGIILFLVSAIPCNTNINCDKNQNKDIFKSLGASFIIYVVLLILINISAKIFLC